jgi:Zn-dependent protease with chaperone function
MGNPIYLFSLGVLEFFSFIAIFFIPIPLIVSLVILLMSVVFGLGITMNWHQSVDPRMLSSSILGKFIYPALLALLAFSSQTMVLITIGLALIALMDSFATIVVSYRNPVVAQK